MGSVKESMNSLTVEDDFQLICFDMVSEPSTPGAYLSPQTGGMTGVTIAMSENKEKQPLTKENKIHSAMDDALKGLV